MGRQANAKWARRRFRYATERSPIIKGIFRRLFGRHPKFWR